MKDELGLGVAGVVDVPCSVATLSAVDHGAIREPEQLREMLVPVDGLDLVGSVALAGVLADDLAAPQRFAGEDTASVDPAAADLDRW